MTVKISFDKAAVERRGYGLEDTHQTVKNLFAVHNLPCVSEDCALAFKDKGHGDDFAAMWDIILALLRAGWFMACASSCVWQDEDGEEVYLLRLRKCRALHGNNPLSRTPRLLKFQSPYRMEKAPPTAGLVVIAPGAALTTQASRFDVKTPLAGELP